MTREDIRQAVLQALTSVAPEIDRQTIASERPFREQLDLDSMDYLNFVIALHTSLGVDVPETDYSKLADLAGAVEYLARRLHVPSA